MQVNGINQGNRELNVQQEPLSSSPSQGVRYAKVAFVASLVFMYSYLAYSHPVIYSLGLITFVSGVTYYACKGVLKISDPKQLQRVLTIAFVASTIGITGAATGWTPYFAEGLLAAFASQNIEQIFKYTSLLTAVLGSIPFFKLLFEWGYVMDASKVVYRILEEWIEMRNSLSMPSKIERLFLFLRLCCREREESESLDEIVALLNEILGSLDKNKAEDKETGKEIINYYFPRIETHLQNQPEKILMVADSVVKWSKKKFVPNLRAAFFNNHKNFFEKEIGCYKDDLFKERIQTLENRVGALDGTPSNEDLQELRKEMQALRQDLTNQLKHLTTCIGVIGDRHPQYGALEGYKTLWQGYSKKLNPQKNSDSLSDTLQLFLNKAEVKKEESIDFEDSVWNYLLVQMSARAKSGERQKPMKDLQAWTGKESLDDIDQCFHDWGIDTLKDLLDKEVATKEELISHPDKVWEKVHAYIDTKKTSDLRSSIYSLLTKPMERSSSFLLKVDRVAAKVAYRALMVLFVLGPVLMRPEQAVVGFVCGIGYGVCVPLHGRISEFIEHQFPGANFIGALFTRRQLFFLNAHSQQDMNSFAGSNLFGRLRLICLESGLGYFITSLDLRFFTEYRPREPVPVGGLIQGFFLGKSMMEETIRLLMNGFARLRQSA